MSGVLNVMAASRPGTRVLVTTANFGVPYGYRLSPAAGAISPTSYKSETISEAFSQPAPGPLIAFRISFTNDGLAQNFFSQISVQKDDGSFITLLSSAADFANSPGAQTTWQWTGDAAWATEAVSRSFYIL
jgi:hypothetical protein